MPRKGSRGFASERQREAAERNLKKGNPSAYSKPKDPPASGEPAKPKAAKTIRAKAAGSQRTRRSASPAPASPPPSASAPPTPTPAATPAPATPERKRHFLDDVLDSVFG